MGKRIRTIKPEFYESEEIQALPRDVRYFLIGLFTVADDHGRGAANPKLIRAAVFPLDDEATPDAIDGWLVDLSDAGIVELYDVAGRSYFVITEWSYWQRVDRPTDSRLPEPPAKPLAIHREDSRDFARSFAHMDGPLAGERESRESSREEDEDAEGDGEGVVSRARPSQFCKRHRIAPTVQPCKACGNARGLQREWDERHLDLDHAVA